MTTKNHTYDSLRSHGITAQDMISISSDTITISDAAITNSVYTASTYNGDFAIQLPSGSTVNVGSALQSIMERLAILEPDFDKMEKYPALREAYNNYKTIEALLAGNDTDQ